MSEFAVVCKEGNVRFASGNAGNGVGVDELSKYGYWVVGHAWFGGGGVDEREEPLREWRGGE